jgi:hypothetical protein
MKARPTRHDVKISARMKGGVAASNASILNASGRGLALHSATPPKRGDYVELRAGEHLMVARVVWVQDEYFGVQTQAAVPAGVLPSVVSNDGRFGSPVAVSVVRRPPRDIFEESRNLANRLQFAFIIVISALAGILAFALIERALQPAATAIRAVLGAHPST